MALREVQVADLRSVPLAVVRRQTLASELATVVSEGCGTVWKFVRAHQLQAGRNVAVYWDGSIRLEVGVELDGALPEGGEVVRSATPRRAQPFRWYTSGRMTDSERRTRRFRLGVPYIITGSRARTGRSMVTGRTTGTPTLPRFVPTASTSWRPRVRRLTPRGRIVS